ncbi:unnamed protein product [Symbiodinium sp. CCMP2592]|nr:unnamed protein product [Symbiodinium sp. CCMP2592]
MSSQPGSGSTPQGFATNTLATQQFLEQRATYQTAEYKAVQGAFFGPPRVKRTAPTPVQSGLTTPQEDSVADEVMREAEEHAEPPEERNLLTPFSLQDQAALEVTLGSLGVNINDQNAVQAWGQRQPTNNAEIFNMVRAYHEKVIRPEYYSLVCQLEAGLKAVDDRCFQVKKEVAWMASENRLLQKHACGLQLLTTGWPNALKPAERVYMISWMVSQVPTLVTFLKMRGYVSDHNASELERHMNVFAQDPTTVPQSEGFYSSMTLLSFKSWDTRSAFLNHYGGSSGVPVYKDESTPIHNKHLKVAPCGPQWQRKLEAPLRVILNCVNKHPEHNASSRLTILWKTLTLMAPQQDAEFHEDHTAWARLHYGQEAGEFVCRLEVVPALLAILNGPPSESDSKTTSLWEEQWYQTMWGNHAELDRMDAEAFSSAKRDAVLSGKGLQKGKGKRHWSSAAVHTSAYSPYPFELHFQVVEAVYFSWDEFCDKYRKEDRKVGDYEVATVQGRPPVGIGAELRSDHTATDFASFGATPAASTATPAHAPAPTTPPTKGGKGKGS